MQKIHVFKTYNHDIETVFKAISDHATFLSGGGLTCEMIKQGHTHPNGNGAIRRVISPKLTFDEKIDDFQLNKQFAYQIIKTVPKQPMLHEKGWLTFLETEGGMRVDWYSNFTITTPVFGGVIGWFAKKQMSKIFKKRLNYLDKVLHN